MRWKRYLAIGAGFGAGAVLMTAILVGAISWYSDRPKGWDKEAIVSNGRVIVEQNGTNTDGYNFSLRVNLQDNTQTDYTLPKTVSIMGRFASSSKALVAVQGAAAIPDDTFIPAKEKTNIRMNFADKCNGDWHQCIEQTTKQIDSFVLFDSNTHREIIIPIHGNVGF